jgi:hypothetical protein
MSPTSLVFAHQRDMVFALAKHFQSIHVFTPEPSADKLPKNVKVSHLIWDNNAIFANVFRIYKLLLPTLLRHRDAVVFSHMTDVHAALISPLTWILRMRHVLWYAHATNSIYLIWSSFFVSKIVSSTSGSCNLKINKDKIRFINQGISTEDFPYFNHKSFNLDKAFYYGRLDQSKNIHLLLELTKICNALKIPISIDIYGKPTNNDSEKYLENLKFSPIAKTIDTKVKFKGSIQRRNVSQVADNYGLFVNLFTGSLDKTLIETTFLGIPVITWNQEYCSQFGTWSKKPIRASLEFIMDEIESLRKLNSMALQIEVASRSKKAIELHSFDGWIERLVTLLKEKGRL